MVYFCHHLSRTHREQMFIPTVRGRHGLETAGMDDGKSPCGKLDASVPCQQAVRQGHIELQTESGVDALEVAGATWAIVHLSCRQQLEMALAIQVMTIRLSRLIVKANERQRQISLSGSARNKRSEADAGVNAVPASTQTTMLHMPCALAARFQLTSSIGRPEFHLQSIRQ